MRSNEHGRLFGRVRDWFDNDEQVDHYLGEVLAGPTPAEDRLLHALPPGGRVLDLGCGAGRIALALGARGHEVTGVDVSTRLINVARELVDERRLPVRLLQVDPTVLPFASGVFDAAIAIKVYCYIPYRSGRIDYLNEIGRVLRAGAVLLLSNYVVPSESAAQQALDNDEAHLRASNEYSSLEPLDTLPLGRGYVHWFTTDTLLAELRSSSLVIEDIAEDASNGRQQLIRLRNQ